MADNKWPISDELWEKMDPFLPEYKTHHPLGTHADVLIIMPQ